MWIFIGVESEIAGIQQTVDEYYENTNMADICVYSENIGYDTLNKINAIEYR